MKSDSRLSRWMWLAGLTVSVGTAGAQGTPLWQEDVSHASIPSAPAVGAFGSRSFKVTRAFVHQSQPMKSRKPVRVEFRRLELTSPDGTPGIVIDLAVVPGGSLEGKTIWRKNMSEHSASVTVNQGGRPIGYPPIQAVWLHGDRDPRFTAMAVYKELGVTDYSVRIEFGKAANGKMPGRIYFCGKPDSFWKSPQSVIAGRFVATILPIGK